MKQIFWVVLILLLCGCQSTFHAQGVDLGLAAQYPNDSGIKNNPDVLLFTDFETADWWAADWGLKQGGMLLIEPQQVSRPVFSGVGALEYAHLLGSHYPSGTSKNLPVGQTVLYLRWYRMYEANYDFSCPTKSPTIFAKMPNIDEGVKPNGFNHYSLRVQDAARDWGIGPRLYVYHINQSTLPDGLSYGDGFDPNIGAKPIIQPGHWTEYELMLKANDIGAKNGEVGLWVDGVLKGWYTGLQFRATETLKINRVTESGWIGGNCVSPKDQKFWDDNVVAATSYIGPLVTPTPTPVPTVTPVPTATPIIKLNCSCQCSE